MLKMKPGGRTPYFLRKKKIREDSQVSQFQDIISLHPLHRPCRLRISIILLSFENKTTLELRLENDRLNGEFEIFSTGSKRHFLRSQIGGGTNQCRF